MDLNLYTKQTHYVPAFIDSIIVWFFVASNKSHGKFISETLQMFTTFFGPTFSRHP